LLREYIYNPSFFGHLLVWLLAGTVSPFAVIPIIFVSNAIWFRDDAYLEVLLGLFFMTLLSDSRNFSLAFAQTVKPLHAIIIFFFFYLKISQFGIRSKIHVNLGLFLIVAIVCLAQSPILFESFQKTFSYFLIIFLIPNLLIWDWELNKEKTIKHLIYFLSIILIIGLLARFLPIPFFNPFLEGRFAGMFGNPNGLGIFCFLFIMILNLSATYYPKIFERKVILFFYTIAIFSAISSGSRGAMLAILAFLSFRYYGYKFGLPAFLAVVALIISFEFAIDILADFAASAGLQEFLRIDTLESGSGRIVALDFAWENIQKNYWLGLGIGYGDYLFKENYYYLAILGHQGQVHNAYLNVWLDTGLIGLTAFVIGWGLSLAKALKSSKFTWAIIVGVFISTNAEVWIIGSLSPWMITFLILLTLVIYMKPAEEATAQSMKEVEKPVILTHA